MKNRRKRDTSWFWRLELVRDAEGEPAQLTGKQQRSRSSVPRAPGAVQRSRGDPQNLGLVCGPGLATLVHSLSLLPASLGCAEVMLVA